MAGPIPTAGARVGVGGGANMDGKLALSPGQCPIPNDYRPGKRGYDASPGFIRAISGAADKVDLDPRGALPRL